MVEGGEGDEGDDDTDTDEPDDDGSREGKGGGVRDDESTIGTPDLFQ